MERKLLRIFFLLFIWVGLAQAQQKEIHGRVTDAKNGEPLVGVSIMIKGTSTGTSTDAEGRFSLQTTTGNTLVATYLGYQRQEILIQDQTSLNISMIA